MTGHQNASIITNVVLISVAILIPIAWIFCPGNLQSSSEDETNQSAGSATKRRKKHKNKSHKKHKKH